MNPNYRKGEGKAKTGFPLKLANDEVKQPKKQVGAAVKKAAAAGKKR